MNFIISEYMVIILYIEVIWSALMCYCKRKIYSAINLYFDDVVVDVITIRGNQNFHLRLFVKVWVVTFVLTKRLLDKPGHRCSRVNHESSRLLNKSLSLDKNFLLFFFLNDHGKDLVNGWQRLHEKNLAVNFIERLIESHKKLINVLLVIVFSYNLHSFIGARRNCPIVAKFIPKRFELSKV
jgi:hypothetical protein